jgi:hypothetical protein
MNKLLQLKEKRRVVIGVLVAAIALGGLGILAARRVFFKSPPQPTAFLTEGFNFDLLRAKEIDWRGPELGYKLDLSRLQDRNGKSLGDVIGKGPAMLVVINSQCGMCTIATDQMLRVRNELSNKGLPYYTVFFISQSREVDFQYADALNLGSPAFVWNGTSGPPAEDVFKIATPSHLLVNGDGTVIRVWPGSYAEKSVRDRMTHQILADTAVAIETLNAVVHEEVSVRK